MSAGKASLCNRVLFLSKNIKNTPVSHINALGDMLFHYDEHYILFWLSPTHQTVY